MWSSLTALGFLGVCGLFGFSVLSRLSGGHLDKWEMAAYGGPLGAVLGSQLILLMASVFGLNLPIILTATMVMALLLPALWRRWACPLSEPTPELAKSLGPESQRGSPFSNAWLLLLLIAGLGLFWSWAFSQNAEGIWAGHPHLWADWARHLGDTASFAFSDNFPPSHPRFSGHPFNYHYLSSITAAVLVEVGMNPIAALKLHSFVYSSFIVLGLYLFSHRLTRDRRAAAFAVVLILMGGGLGWWWTVDRIMESGEVIESLLQSPWPRQALSESNFEWKNIFFSLIAPQRSYLYGLPLGLLVLTLLLSGTHGKSRLPFVAAGIFAALLPFSHLGTLLALALITPFLTILSPSRHWLWFYGLWALIGAPQILLQQAGVPTVARAIRFQPGWLAPPDPWLVFWFKNLGGLVTLLPIAFIARGLLPQESRRFLLAFMPLFVIANFIVFQPWAWNNTNVLVYWYLATCVLVAALLARLWQSRRGVVRIMVLLLVAMMILSSVLESWSFALGRERVLLLTGEEIRLAQLVRSSTGPSDRFVVGLQHNHPIPVLTGRRVLMSYPGWHWSHGIDTSVRRRHLEEIYSLGSDAPRLLEQYEVDFVVVGPYEIRELHANNADFRARYPSIAKTATYEVFAVASSGERSVPAAEPLSHLEGLGSQREITVDRVEEEERKED